MGACNALPMREEEREDRGHLGTASASAPTTEEGTKEGKASSHRHIPSSHQQKLPFPSVPTTASPGTSHQNRFFTASARFFRSFHVPDSRRVTGNPHIRRPRMPCRARAYSARLASRHRMQQSYPSSRCGVRLVLARPTLPALHGGTRATPAGHAHTTDPCTV